MIVTLAVTINQHASADISDPGDKATQCQFLLGNFYIWITVTMKTLQKYGIPNLAKVSLELSTDDEEH